MKNHNNEHKRNAKLISAAMQLINNAKGNLTSVWKNNPGQAQFFNSLLDRVNDPHQIDQSGTNTCGPATYWYALAYYRPDLYVSTMIELYEKGNARLGKMNIQPSEEVFGSWKPNNYQQVALVDWIAFVSLKNTTSRAYNERFMAVEGITRSGEIKKWLNNTGWSVQANTADIGLEGLSDLKAASLAFSKQMVVFLFVRSKGINKGSGFKLWKKADHWICLTSTIKVRGANTSWQPIHSVSVSDSDLLNYQIDFGCYTWGHYRGVGADHTSVGNTSTVKDWLSFYCGYLSANIP